MHLWIPTSYIHRFGEGGGGSRHPLPWSADRGTSGLGFSRASLSPPVPTRRQLTVVAQRVRCIRRANASGYPPGASRFNLTATRFVGTFPICWRFAHELKSSHHNAYEIDEDTSTDLYLRIKVCTTKSNITCLIPRYWYQSNVVRIIVVFDPNIRALTNNS